MTADLSAELYVAGAILIDDQTIRAINGHVSADDFESEHCRIIFEAALSLSADDAAIDPVSIMGKAKQLGMELPRQYVLELMEVVPTAANCIEYALRVAEDARTRRI